MRRFRLTVVFCLTLAAALAIAPASAQSSLPVNPALDLAAGTAVKPAPGMFLVATRALDDYHFGQSIVYLVEHGEEGTMGLIVNRSSGSQLSQAVPDLESQQAADHVLYYGGPVGLPLVLILLRNPLATDGVTHVAADVYISSDREVIEDLLAADTTDSELRFYIGHSGWAAGQLDFELERGSWHVVPADADMIFSADTDSLWERLIEKLEPQGIQVENRSPLPPAGGTGYSAMSAQTPGTVPSGICEWQALQERIMLLIASCMRAASLSFM